jgi:hypothetical protein
MIIRDLRDYNQTLTASPAFFLTFLSLVLEVPLRGQPFVI